jgi:hypothetical protein
MTELESLERLMIRLIQQRRALPRDRELTQLAAEHFTGNDRLSPVEQLEIYRQQFWLRHTSALLEDFPGVSGIVGQREWERLAEEYLAAHPPTAFSLRDLGADFPTFIRENARWLEHRELVSDMARLEWAYVEVFDAADAPPLSPEKLAIFQERDWERVRLVLSPALRLLRVAYPVVELRRQLMRPAESGVQAVPIPERAPSRLAVHRALRTIQSTPLTEAPFAVLEALASGATLPEACEVACDQVPDSAEAVSRQLGAWFANWVERSFIVDVRLP